MNSFCPPARPNQPKHIENAGTLSKQGRPLRLQKPNVKMRRSLDYLWIIHTFIFAILYCIFGSFSYFVTFYKAVFSAFLVAVLLYICWFYFFYYQILDIRYQNEKINIRPQKPNVKMRKKQFKTKTATGEKVEENSRPVVSQDEAPLEK